MYGLDYSIVEGLLLGFLRTGTALVLMPVFGYVAVPVQVKVGLALVLAIILAPTAALHLAVGPPGLVPIVAAAITEVMVGMIFGMVAMLLMIGAQVAGSVVGIQMGFGIAQVIDPQSGGQISLIAKMQYSLALILFIILDVHHRFLEALAHTFDIIPLGGALFPGDIALSYGRLTAEVFVVGVKLASPLIAILFMVQISLGVMARIMPRMNILIEGFTVKIGVGMLGLAVTLPLFVYVLSKSFDVFIDGIVRIIRMMAGI